MDTDFLLVQKIHMGDEKAVETLVSKYYPKILNYCHMRIQDYGYAEDMTQETFVRFFRTLPQYRLYGKVSNYLYAIAANACNDYYRKRREIPLDTLPEKADAQAENPDRRLNIHIALERMPEDIKQVAVLFFLQEQKQKDIARILGISLPLVKYRIRKAREAFLAYFQDEP